MKEFIGIARNIYETIDEESGERTLGAEIVITASEPKPVIKKGKLTVQRKLSHIRFCCSIEAIELLAMTTADIMKSVKKLGLVQKPEAEEGGQ